MRRVFFALALIFITSFLSAQDKRPLPAQVQRGRDVFTKTDKAVPCATCHQLKDVGTAVGPDLRTLSSAVGPHGIIMAMHMTIPAYVQEVKLADGTVFQGMPKPKQGEEQDVWDLSQNPPVLRKLTSKDIASMKGSTTWKHPPATAEFTTHEMADLIGFLKWAATGSSKEIKPEDVEEAK